MRASTRSVLLNRELRCRPPSGVERYSYGYDTLAPHCPASTLCHYHLRHHRARAFLRAPAQNLLQQHHRYSREPDPTNQFLFSLFSPTTNQPTNPPTTTTMAIRSPGCAQQYPNGHDPPAPHSTPRYICHDHLCNHWTRALLGNPA